MSSIWAQLVIFMYTVNQNVMKSPQQYCFFTVGKERLALTSREVNATMLGDNLSEKDSCLSIQVLCTLTLRKTNPYDYEIYELNQP